LLEIAVNVAFPYIPVASEFADSDLVSFGEAEVDVVGDSLLAIAIYH